ncbi:DpnII family type II restriction endonuclease [endosymbiont GvMRE of Glomus versiforme]|uniref:DpnII family type II restriction endonuclease n=1 Tax=endosymbiont GvMRE of Glomus versiforme TaxID=2039283 RepID=UPI000EDE2E16|nr:DpnII family type II restriction endonuclease [endosymbiont GvMRE of Glomus versiforme]RHZ35879.1 Site-specific DNA-methyltransferase (adenine-specific) [endosymbiont GvMRE of Glomus versiforme]
MNKNLTTKPFIKWAGGKTQFLEVINLLLPNDYNQFIEPFVGGGSVFLNKQPNKAIINDANKELIITYKIIKNQPKELLKLLKEYEKNHSQDFYETLRRQETKNLTELGTVARFIYLNKTGYNGLYRVNSQGEFNVPWGKREKVKLFDTENILTISKYLNENNCQILNQDYQELLPLIQAGDFLFVDPPYDSEKSNGFTAYTANGFTRENQKELFNFLKECEKKGAKWLLTNHATDFIKDLYKDYQQFTKKAQRFINCQGEKRIGSAQEIFVWNYELSKEKKQQLEFEKWFDTIQTTNVDLSQLVNWKKIQSNLMAYEKDLNILNSLICANKEELNQRIQQIWQEAPQSFQALPLLLAIRDNENFAWLEKENIEYWENLTLEKVKKLIFNSGLAQYLTNGKIKNLKDYCLGVEVGLGTHSKKNLVGTTMEKAVETLLNKYQVKYQKQVPVNFQVNGKKLFDFQIKLDGKEYYLETSFYNSPGSKVSEIIRSYNGVLQKAYNNEINFLWVLDGKGLKSVKELLKEVYLVNKGFMFTIASFGEWLGKQKGEKVN